MSLEGCKILCVDVEKRKGNRSSSLTQKTAGLQYNSTGINLGSIRVVAALSFVHLKFFCRVRVSLL